MEFRRILLIQLAVSAAVSAVGQPVDEHLGLKRPETWAMRYFTAAGLMQGSAPPSSLGKGQFALGFEAANLPHLSKAYRTVGFNGTKEENLNKAPLLARPLLHYGLTDRLSLTAAYVPPVEIFDRLETHLAGLYANYEVLRRDSFRVLVRAGLQWSEAQGDFTCPEEIAGIMDPSINPYGCEEPSNDTFTSLGATLEVAGAYRLKTRLPAELLVSVAWTHADMEFEVDAHWAGGVHDHRRLHAKGGIWSFLLGCSLELRENLHATLAVAHTPLDVRRPPDYGIENDSLTHFRIGFHLLL